MAALMTVAEEIYRTPKEFHELRQRRSMPHKTNVPDYTNSKDDHDYNCDIPQEIRRLDDLISLMDQKTVRKGGEISRHRTRARLRLHAKDTWTAPKAGEAKHFAEPPPKQEPEKKRPGLRSAEAMESELDKIHLMNRARANFHKVDDYDSLQRYMRHQEKRKEEMVEAQKRDHKIEQRRKLVREQEDLLKSLSRTHRSISTTEAYADLNRFGK